MQKKCLSSQNGGQEYDINYVHSLSYNNSLSDKEDRRRWTVALGAGERNIGTNGDRKA